MLARVFGLLPRQGHPHHFHAVALGEKPARAAPPAADVENPGIRRKRKLAGDQFQFRLLRLVQGFGVAPVAAGIQHPFAQHPAVEVVAHVVVLPGDLPGPGAGLHVQDPRKPGHHDLVDSGDLILQAGPQHAGEKFIQRIAIPPTVHVGFAEAERALRQNPPVKPGVVDLDVPGPGAVFLDPGRRQGLQCPLPRNRHVQPPADDSNWCASTVQPSLSIVSIRQEGPA